MTLAGDPAYTARYRPELLAWLQSFPLWRKLWWSATCAAGVAGSLYLLLRRRLAVPLLTLACASLAASIAYDFLVAGGGLYYGSTGLIASAILLLFTCTVAVFARAALRRPSRLASQR